MNYTKICQLGVLTISMMSMNIVGSQPQETVIDALKQRQRLADIRVRLGVLSARYKTQPNGNGAQVSQTNTLHAPAPKRLDVQQKEDRSKAQILAAAAKKQTMKERWNKVKEQCHRIGKMKKNINRNKRAIAFYDAQDRLEKQLSVAFDQIKQEQTKEKQRKQLEELARQKKQNEDAKRTAFQKELDEARAMLEAMSVAQKASQSPVKTTAPAKIKSENFPTAASSSSSVDATRASSASKALEDAQLKASLNTAASHQPPVVNVAPKAPITPVQPAAKTSAEAGQSAAASSTSSYSATLLNKMAETKAWLDSLNVKSAAVTQPPAQASSVANGQANKATCEAEQPYWAEITKENEYYNYLEACYKKDKKTSFTISFDDGSSCIFTRIDSHKWQRTATKSKPKQLSSYTNKYIYFNSEIEKIAQELGIPCDFDKTKPQHVFIPLNNGVTALYYYCPHDFTWYRVNIPFKNEYNEDDLDLPDVLKNAREYSTQEEISFESGSLWYQRPVFGNNRKWTLDKEMSVCPQSALLLRYRPGKMDDRHRMLPKEGSEDRFPIVPLYSSDGNVQHMYVYDPALKVWKEHYSMEALHVEPTKLD
jgi:hypothetical protein